MKINPGFLIVKGNFSYKQFEKQFETLGKFWADVQNPERISDNWPIIQLPDLSSIEIIQLQPDGNFISTHPYKCACTDSEDSTLTSMNIDSTGNVIISVDNIEIKKEEGDK